MSINSGHGIMFHHFYDNRVHLYGQGAINQCDFNNIIENYSKKYKIINAEDYLYKSMKGKLGKNEVCLTFDDALKSQIDIAVPILKEMKFTAFFFIYTSPLIGIYEKLEIYRNFRCVYFSSIDEFYFAFFKRVEEEQRELKINYNEEREKFEPKKYLLNSPFYSDEDRFFRYIRDRVLGREKYEYIMDGMLKEYHYNFEGCFQNLWMSKYDIKNINENGNIIGLHSHTHPTCMEKLSLPEQRIEYEMNKEILESIICGRIETVSYPCSSYNDDTLFIMKKLGIKLGFTAFMKRGKEDLLNMPRQDSANILRTL